MRRGNELELFEYDWAALAVAADEQGPFGILKGLANPA